MPHPTCTQKPVVTGPPSSTKSHLQGRLSLSSTTPPLKRINFPSAVPATALLGSPVGAGSRQGPLRPEGSSRGPAAEQRRGPPAPVRQGGNRRCSCPRGPCGSGEGAEQAAQPLPPSFLPSLPPPVRGPGRRRGTAGGAAAAGREPSPADPARPPRRGPVPAPRAEPGSDCATAAARRDMGRAGGAPRRTFKPAPAAGLQLPAAAGLRRDRGGTTARLRQDYSSRSSGHGLCPWRRRAAGPGGGDGGAVALSARRLSPRRPGRSVLPRPPACAASHLLKEGPSRPSRGRADLPPSRSVPFLRRRTRDAFVRLRALGWARSSAWGHGRADGLGAAADDGQVVGHKEGLDVMERADPLFLLIGLPTIPVMLILGKMIRWEDYVLRLWRKYSNKLQILNSIFPGIGCPVPRIPAEANPLADHVSATRILCGALVFPTIATIVGKLMFSSVNSNLQRTILGGIAFVAIKGAFKVYFKQQQYLRQAHRKILNYPEQEGA
uniref:Membrane associated ring-CH-type finger 5 n=1 Tax=Taeniopygia guttata TaxID=59729 RepID=A0A674GXJ3_TAEGU